MLVPIDNKKGYLIDLTDIKCLVISQTYNNGLNLTLWQSHIELITTP